MFPEEPTTKTNVFKRYRGRFASLRNLLWFRLSLYIILGTTLPLLAFAFIATWHAGSTIYGQTTRFSTELADTVSRNIQREINTLQIISIDIAYSDTVQNLSLNYEYLTHDEMQVALSEARLDIARRLTFILEITDVHLFLGDGDNLHLYGNTTSIFRLQPQYERHMVDYAIGRNGRLALFAYGPTHQMAGLRLQQDLINNTAECLMLVRAIRSLPHGDILGVLALRLNTRFFNDSLRDINVGEGVQFMAFDTHGITTLTTDETLFTTGMAIEPDVLAQLMRRGDDLSYLNRNGQSYLVYDARIDELGWTVVLLVPTENLEREIRTMILTFLLILGTALLLCILVIHAFHRIFNRPMIRLVNAMNAADGGSLHVEVENVSADEIGQATRSFNNMLMRIRQLLDDVKSEEAAKRSAELAALQAQINPHFLSNTLGVAKVMAQNQKAENIDQLLTALIDLLHISMGVGGDMISLREEIKYVQSYVEIMRFRNYADLEVQYHIQPEAADCLVPKLILQPLVENALTHGLTVKGRPAKIDVRAIIDGGDLCLTVTDNGSGISEEKIESIMNTSPTESGGRFSGIALPNVQGRIRRLFGNDYGLFIDSIPNMFTTIEITIPVKRDNDK